MEEANEYSDIQQCVSFLMNQLFTLTDFETHSLRGRQAGANKDDYEPLPALDAKKIKWIEGMKKLMIKIEFIYS